MKSQKTTTSRNPRPRGGWNRRLDDHDVELIRRCHEHGMSITTIAEKFEISHSYAWRLAHYSRR